MDDTSSTQTSSTHSSSTQTVSTTGPDFEDFSSLPFPIYTQRLVIRRIETTDKEAAGHMIAEENNAMIQWAGTTEPPDDLDRVLDHFTSDLTDIFLGIFLKDGEEELIGMGGIFTSVGQWSEVHYVLKEKHWGHGYCSEFVKALLEMWWNLPRDEREVDCPTMLYTGDSEQKELLMATPLPGNSRSKKVLEKAGFHFRGLLDGREVWSATSNNEH